MKGHPFTLEVKDLDPPPLCNMMLLPSGQKPKRTETSQSIEQAEYYFSINPKKGDMNTLLLNPVYRLMLKFELHEI